MFATALYRGCRVPSTSLPRPHVSFARRTVLSTTRPSLAQVGKRAMSTAAPQTDHKPLGTEIGKALPKICLLAFASAFAGTFLATSIFGNTKEDVESRTASSSSSKPKYGSPKDFSLAIEELKATFSDRDVVSVNPDDLKVHGYSENDYHPGKHEPSLSSMENRTDRCSPSFHRCLSRGRSVS
jgi:hypothetical protein